MSDVYGGPLLETHPCQGGATAGYMRAGWHVTAVDFAKKHAKYNPAQAFIVADAVPFIREFGAQFEARHASPPCQWYTRGNAPRRNVETKWERTIPAVRAALEACDGPYVIENVKDAIWDLRDPVMLCGCMFDLSTIDTDGIRIHLQRPRMFEVNFPIPGLVEQEVRVGGVDYVVRSPRPCDHSEHEWVAGAYGGARRDKYEAKYVRKGGYVPRDKAVVKALLGIEHDMTWEGLFECLPPAYTQWMGSQLVAYLEARAAA